MTGFKEEKQKGLLKTNTSYSVVEKILHWPFYAKNKESLGIRLHIVGIVQSLDFTGLNLVYDITKSSGTDNPLIEEKVKQGHLGARTSKGLYDYGGRSEEEILRKRDLLYLKMLDFLENLEAFKPV